MKRITLITAMLLLWGIGKAISPTLLYPVNAIDTQAVRLKFAFHPVSNMQYYDLQIDTTPLFNSPLLKDSIGTIDYSALTANDTIVKIVIDMYYGTTQYWRVRARNSSDTTDWSVIQNFTTRAYPIITIPSSNFSFSNMGAAGTLWKNIGGSISYQVQVGSTTVFVSPIYMHNAAPIALNYPHMKNISISFFGLPPSPDYYLKIKAYNDVDSSDWTPEIHFQVIDQTSVSEKELSSFSIFPNPAKERINILSQGNMQLSIFDMEGKQVFQSRLNSLTESIDISVLSQGTYFLQLNTAEKTVIQKLVVMP